MRTSAGGLDDRARQVGVLALVEGFYNPRRIHSTLGNLSPVTYEQRHSLVAQSA
ncbi:MAG: hypothetical protein WBA31_05955 [Candidatus Dormiibacterota bacterium]